MQYWLGVDIGTGGSRALLVNDAGCIVSGFTAIHEDIQMSHPLWAEQRPQNWWDAAIEAIQGVMAQADINGEDVAGIGLSGQMHGLVLLDANNQVVRPAIIWCDQRCQEQVDWINSVAGKEMVVEQTANPVLTGFTAPKLIWVRDYEPANYEKTRCILLPKDYVRFCLTGEFFGDVSDASGTALFDVVNRCWAKDLIEKLGIDHSLLPPVVESSEVAGVVTAAAALRTGLREGTPVVAGAGDQAAGAVGAGVVESGLVSCTIGTSGVVFSHLDRVDYDPQGRVHTFCHAVPKKWHVMGVTQGAGLSLQWFRNQLGADAVAEAEEKGVDPYDFLIEEGMRASEGSEGLFWLPYLMGERTPHLDPQARGGWVGLTAKHTRADLIRSVIEGVSYSLKDCLSIVESLGVDVETVRVLGGGARNPFWRKTLADIFGFPITTLETQEGSAFGAALLAMVGSGHHSSVGEACRVSIREHDRVVPNGASTQEYKRRHSVFQSLYPALRQSYRDISQL